MSSAFPLRSTSPVRSAGSPAAELQRRWKHGPAPTIEEFLGESPVNSLPDLAALVRVDLRQRWRHGEKPEAREYLGRFPELASDPELALDLIYAEFLAREEFGQQSDDWALRYPRYAGVLQDQIDLHQAIDACNHPLPQAEETGLDELAAEPTWAIGSGHASNLRAPIPEYEILDEIGRGGMGIVYRARQVSLNRLVALKMVRSWESASSELLTRFRAEAEAVARLHHPQIVQIYDYGEHSGLPYLALELVEGSTLATQLDGRPWPAAQAASLVESLARTVHFAHQQGVIHRDLKPANVLLAPVDGEPQSDVMGRIPRTVPKITDFGLAMVFNEGPSRRTESGAILGTLNYMAPEQAAGRPERIGPATDVYALGAILYELLTGRPPFQAESPLEILQQVISEEPVSLWRLQQKSPRDLATICGKCLSKEPRQRYSTAGELAADLARFLADQPIHARPVSSLERSWRWCRRNPLAASLASLVAILLLTVAAGSLAFSVGLQAQLRKTQAAQESEQQAKHAAQLRLFDSYVAEASARHTTRKIGQRFGTLDTLEQASGVLDAVGRTDDRILRLRNAAIAALVLPDLRRLRPVAGESIPLKDLALTVPGDRYALLAPDKVVAFRLSDGRQLSQIDHEGGAVATALSSNGHYVALAGPRGAKVWRIQSEPPTLVWAEVGASFPTFSPDGQKLAVCTADNKLRLIDLAAGLKLGELGDGPAKSGFAFHHATGRVAVCGTDHVQVLETASGKLLCRLPGFATGFFNPAVAWHPSGEYLAVTGGREDGVVLWHVDSQQKVQTYPHTGGKVSVHFTAEGDQFLSHDAWNGNLRLWQTMSGRQLLSDATFPHFASDFNDAGQLRLLAMEPNGPALWEVETASAFCNSIPRLPGGAFGAPVSMDISPDGSCLAIGLERGIEVWDWASRRSASLELSRDCFGRFVRDGSLLIRCESGIYRWPVNSKSGATAGDLQPAKVRFGPPEKLCGPTLDYKFAVSPAMDALIYQNASGWHVLDPASPDKQKQLGPLVDPRMVSVSRDGRLLALGCWEGGATVFDAQTGAPVCRLPVGSYADVLFSPNGRWLATSPSGVELWRTGSWLPGPKVHSRGTTVSGLGIAFSPDSRVLAIGQPTGETRFVDPETGADWAALAHPHEGLAASLQFSPDQTQLVILGTGATAMPTIWNLTAIRRELAARNLDWPADVLKAQPGPSSSGQQPRRISFDDGNLPRRQQAAALLRQAGSTPVEKLAGLFELAIELDPQNALAHNNLAWQLATGPEQSRDSKRALEHARRAVALDGLRHSFLNTLGVALYRAGETDESIKILEQSLQSSPEIDAPYDLLFLALAHAKRGNWDLANDQFVRARATIDQNQHLLSSASREELGRFLDEAHSAGLPQ